MPRLALRKRSDGILVPVGTSDEEFIAKLKPMQVIRANFKRQRNYLFHRKFFALVRVAYDSWEPGEVELNGRLITPEADFEEFRKWLVIKAGFYEVIGYPDGSVRARAKSLKFDSMREDEFGRLYNNVLSVAIKHVMQNCSREDMESVVAQVMSFD